jgi:hypothetical protein
MLYQTAYSLKNTLDEWKIPVSLEMEFPEILINSGPNRITVRTDSEAGYFFVHAYENDKNVKVYEVSNHITLLAVIFRLLDFRQ